MSLHTLAQNLASKGRRGDTMLVHMTPGEVGGLQALAMAHGGSLTVNPHTGLPEANFLKRLLPTLVGAGLTFFSGGAINPLTAGMIVGGFEGVRTGNLGQGIMAGLGAFGGAGLGSALTAAGAATPSAVASNLGVQGAATGAGSQASMLAAQNAGFGQAGLEATRQAAATAAGANMAPALSNVQLAGQGLSNLGTAQGMSNLGTGLQTAFPTMTQKVLAATPAMSELALATAPKPAPLPEPEKSNYAGPYVPNPRSVRFPGARERDEGEFSFFDPTNPYPGFQPGLRLAAEGGLMGLAQGGIGDDRFERDGDNYALGGLTALASGRYLQGPGDGTSDSIPAMISARQPARLADGEFVVDARTVSELGNGSSNAGAKKLYAMMDRVHSARKKAKRGQDSKAERYMPA